MSAEIHGDTMQAQFNVLQLDLRIGTSDSSDAHSSRGCWTCRVRRKRCDLLHPICQACKALQITCHYGQERPEWMDGASRQEEVVQQLKRDIKSRPRRRTERVSPAIDVSGAASSAPVRQQHEDSQGAQGRPLEPSQRSDEGRTSRCSVSPEAIARSHAECAATRKAILNAISFEYSETVLLSFYLEQLIPFFYPMYHPSIQSGGKAWILEMVVSSPVVRQATLCHSSYVYSLVRAMDQDGLPWETVLTHTREVFTVLRRALQVIGDSDLRDHMSGAVRILVSIVQVQRFDLAVLRLENCQLHLNAAIALFKQLLDTADVTDPALSFAIVLDRVRPTSPSMLNKLAGVPSAEQEAFRFSSALLLFDDVVASTVLRQRPRLYQYHGSLLSDARDDASATWIDLEAVTGCQNWVLASIGEISALAARKHEEQGAGKLDVMEMVGVARQIQDTLETHMVQVRDNPVRDQTLSLGFLDMFSRDVPLASQTSINQHTQTITLVWAHAATLYLNIVMSGWQPASKSVQYHVKCVMDALTSLSSSPALLRTSVWPFCVAGCLAEPALYNQFRAISSTLQPACLFGTLYKAVDVMEETWRRTSSADPSHRDLASCFESQAEFLLLV